MPQSAANIARGRPGSDEPLWAAAGADRSSETIAHATRCGLGDGTATSREQPELTRHIPCTAAAITLGSVRQSHCLVAVGLAAFSKNSFWSLGPVSSRLMARIALAIRADEARVAASPRAAVAPAASP